MPARASDALLDAIRTHDLDSVRTMMATNPAQCEHTGPGSESLVMYALYTGGAALAPVLLGTRQYTACEAAALGDIDALRAALDSDADVISRRSSDGWTPLHLAGFFGHDDSAAFLIDNGAPLDALSTNAIRNTPLHAALAGATNSTLVRRLIMAGANVTSRGETGIQPIHLAASRGDQPLCELLVSRGAFAMVRMDDGTTPADLAHQRGFEALAEWLEQQLGED